MSEPESNTIALPGEAPPIVASAAEELRKDTAVASHRLSTVIALLALVLIIATAVGTAWVLQRAQSREAALAQRVAVMEATGAQKQSDLGELNARELELKAGIASLKMDLDQKTTTLSSNLQSIEEELAQQQKELARFSASDRESWLLAETGHLLRLANQRLVMAGDPVAAQALLNNADSVLHELDDPDLHAVRAAVAADIAALRAVPKVDVEGIYLRLAALIEQAGKLVIFQFAEHATPPGEEVAQDWQGRLRQGYKAALAQLSDYIIIRRRDVPMQALMDPQWEGLVRQNLRMLLEQAQIALLSGNQLLYGASLEQAQQWVSQFRDSDTAAAEAIAAQLRQLASLTIQIPQPNISRSQQALDEAIEQRAQSAGELQPNISSSQQALDEAIEQRAPSQGEQ